MIKNLDDCIYRTGFLAESTENTFSHVYIISSSSTRAIFSGFCFNCNGLIVGIVINTFNRVKFHIKYFYTSLNFILPIKYHLIDYVNIIL